MKLYDAPGANTMAVRLFILERGGLELEVQQVDIMTMENRKPAYRNNVNTRGELPALRISDDFVLTEITAVNEYLDEVATVGQSLFGTNALERAETRMWTRRMDLEIAQPVIEFYRNDPETISFYRGNRVPVPEARLSQQLAICKALNRLDDELENKHFLCGDRFSAADVHFYGLVKPMTFPVKRVLDDARKNVVEYFERLDARDACKKALEPFKESRIKV
jgi:glutathione S-transferase